MDPDETLRQLRACLCPGVTADPNAQPEGLPQGVYRTGAGL